MALVLADRVKETTTTTGIGDISLGGAETNFVAFGSALSDGDTTYYAIVDDGNSAFEVGIGTYTSGANTLARTTILSSSNAGSVVNLASGTKTIFITLPAEKAVSTVNLSFPFYDSSTTLDSIALVSNQDLPFFKADGTQDNITVTT